MKKYGKQYAVITYGSGINVREFLKKYQTNKFVIIFDAGFVRIHLAK